MRSIEYPRTEGSRKVWPQFWTAVDGLLERARAGLPKFYSLKHVSIDAETGAVTVFFEVREVPTVSIEHATR